jgi:hypothetical protein
MPSENRVWAEMNMQADNLLGYILQLQSPGNAYCLQIDVTHLKKTDRLK